MTSLVKYCTIHGTPALYNESNMKRQETKNKFHHFHQNLMNRASIKIFILLQQLKGKKNSLTIYLPHLKACDFQWDIPRPDKQSRPTMREV